MIDIRLYSMIGYDKESDDFVTEKMKKIQPEMDWEFIREHIYDDDHRKKLDNLNVLARQMVNRRFGFFSQDGSVLSGVVTGFSWNESRVVMDLHLRLDVEPDAKISYSVSIHSGLYTKEDTVIITDDGVPGNPLMDEIPPNSLRIEL